MTKKIRAPQDRKVYFRPITLEVAGTPWNQKDAATLKLLTFTADCQACGKPTQHFATEGACVECSRKRVSLEFEALKMEAAINGTIFLTDRVKSAAIGLDWYYGGAPAASAPMCPKGPHLRISNINTGRCVTCEKLSKKSAGYDRRRVDEERPDNLIISRDEARTQGRTTYRTGRPCSHGHIGYRYVSTGSCVDCLSNLPDRPENLDGYDGRRGPQRIIRDPALILSRQEAIATGQTTYRTGEPCKYGHRGHRWTSTGGCLDCMAGMPSPSDWPGSRR